MKQFKHLNVRSVEEASEALGSGNAAMIAGGTDLLGVLKDNILETYPEAVVNLKSIPGLDRIREENGNLRIGSLARLADIAESELVSKKYTALAQAAKAVATPNIRNMATIGGNLAQFNRCWYFRKSENRFDCIRKGGRECFAETGDNRYHSIFGGLRIGASACKTECPAATDIPDYLEQMRGGDPGKAAQTIMKANPMPMITSRICAHPCQLGCNRCQSDESVNISAIERAVGDFIMEHRDEYYRPPAKGTAKKAAIVGAGPAGLSAAYFLRRAGLGVTVFDKKEEAGGMLMYAIPPYRLPRDIVRGFVSALRKMGVEFQVNKEIGKDILPEKLECEYDCVLYATGAWKRPIVGITGEELTVFGLDFLMDVKNWMKGKIGSEVLVAGGGNVAMDVAVTARRLGAGKVTLVCLESREEMPASPEEIERAEDEGIAIMPGWGLSRVLEAGGEIKGMELKRCVSVRDEEGKFNPQYDESQTMEMKAENILMAVGQAVDLSYFGENIGLQLTRRGLIDVSDDTKMTSKEGVFASGDVTTGPDKAIGAVVGGRKAAEGILRHLKISDPKAAEAPGESCLIRFDPEGVRKTEALKLGALDGDKRSLDLEDSISPKMDEAKREAARCRNCGCYCAFPSDIATSLSALGADIVTNRRTLSIDSLYGSSLSGSTVLEPGEIITEVAIPAPEDGSHSAFLKMAWRKSIDFPVVNCAVSTGSKARVCIGAVAPKPYRAINAEALITGKEISEKNAEEAGLIAVEGAIPFEAARYKAQLAKVLVKRALLAAGKQIAIELAIETEAK
ncbi:MAG: FAD binding domain-containing protein [Clostridiales Family XIII bacterium]|jgi:NADPH-dependent glutamate synthase beta subunit-like oxidoreductase/CO/xanthine dehydrogenase FAD-binding subunit|nr:FAD binding domain-containing protein [Clostridiales Family XIII bacterium]